MEVRSICSFFRIVLSSLISKGREKSNMTLVRSRDISHWITANWFVLTTMKGSGIFSSGMPSFGRDCCDDFSRCWFRWTRFRKHTCWVRRSLRASFFWSIWCRRYSISLVMESMSCFAAVGSPFQVISFFCLEIMSIAIRTLRAS